MHARQLPLAHRCTRFVGRPADTCSPAYCDRCQQPVHDLSRRTHAEVVALVRAHAGRRLCVAYRVREDGVLVLRRARRVAPAVMVAATLLGCAPYRIDEPASGDGCVDAAGFEVPCPPRAGVLVIPQAPPPPPPPRAQRPSRRPRADARDGEFELMGVLDDAVVGELAPRR